MGVDELASHEPADAVAFGAFEGDELVAVGLVGPEGEPGDWRVRGTATKPEARGRRRDQGARCTRGARDRARRDAPVVQRADAGALAV